MKAKTLGAKILIYMLGLLVMAFGIAFSIRSNLGISPVSSLPFAVSHVTGISTGTFVTLFFVVYIVLQIAMLRRRYKWINLTQILVSVVFGYFVDFAMVLTEGLMLPTYLGQLLMLAISIYLISFGLVLYVEARLIVLPPEGLVLTVTELIRGGTFSKVKIAFDCLLVALAIIVTFVFSGSVYGVREGTVLSALLIGKLVPFNNRIVGSVLGKTGYYRLTKKIGNL